MSEIDVSLRTGESRRRINHRSRRC